MWRQWEGEAPAEPETSGGVRLGRSLALPITPADIVFLTINYPYNAQQAQVSGCEAAVSGIFDVHLSIVHQPHM